MAIQGVHKSSKKPTKPTESGNWVPCDHDYCNGFGEYEVSHVGTVGCSHCLGKGWVDLDRCPNCKGLKQVNSFLTGWKTCPTCGGTGKKK